MDLSEALVPMETLLVPQQLDYMLDLNSAIPTEKVRDWMLAWTKQLVMNLANRMVLVLMRWLGIRLVSLMARLMGI